MDYQLEATKNFCANIGPRNKKRFLNPPMYDMPLDQNFNIFFQVNEMRDEAKTWWFWARCCVILFFKKNICVALESRTLIWVLLLQAMTLKYHYNWYPIPCLVSYINVILGKNKTKQVRFQQQSCEFRVRCRIVHFFFLAQDIWDILCLVE